jgi:alkaline phosphatase D
VNADDPERIYRTVGFGPAVEVFALDLRSYRGANNPNRQTVSTPESALAGADQVEWFKTRLAASRATWKVIASDMPIGVTITDGPGVYEAFANADPGPPSGRELEVASILKFIKDRGIRNTVWVTADIPYCAAHHYQPSRASFTDFDPFWEFVAGPLNAGTFGPNRMDGTFGPEVVFTGIPPGMKGNRPPSDGYQFFGKMRIDRTTKALTVTLHDISGKTLFSKELAPQ